MRATQAEFKERDEEMDHKFNLQVAENKRGSRAETRLVERS